MGRLLILLLLNLSAGKAFAGQYQSIWFAENRHGAYFQTYYQDDLAYIQFQSCGKFVGKYFFDSVCARVDTHKISLKDAEFYEQALIARLKILRESYAQTRWPIFKGLGSPKKNLPALDELIFLIERYGLQSLILTGKRNYPEFTSAELYRQVTEVFRSVLEQPLPEPWVPTS